MDKIMLVEDDPTMLDLLTTLFNLEGYEIVLVDQEIGVIESMRSYEPDLIIMDGHLRMAGMKETSGLELLGMIRSDPDLQDKKVLMVSGMDLRIESKEAGADDFIVKPFMIDELISKIKKIME